MDRPEIDHSEKFSWVEYASRLEKKAELLSRDMLTNYSEHKRFVGLSDENKHYKKGYLDGVRDSTKYARLRLHFLFNTPYTEAYDD